MCIHSWQWQSKYPMGYRTLKKDTKLVVSNENLNGNFITNNNNNDNHGFNQHFKALPVANHMKSKNIALTTTKLLKGKCFALEVNNNEEDIVV